MGRRCNCAQPTGQHSIVQREGTTLLEGAGQPRRLRPGQVLLLDACRDIEGVSFSRSCMLIGVEFGLYARRLEPVDRDQPNGAWQPLPGQADQPTWQDIIGPSLPAILPPSSSAQVAPCLIEAARTWWQHRRGRLQAIHNITQAVLHL